MMGMGGARSGPGTRRGEARVVVAMFIVFAMVLAAGATVLSILLS